MTDINKAMQILMGIDWGDKDTMTITQAIVTGTGMSIVDQTGVKPVKQPIFVPPAQKAKPLTAKGQPVKMTIKYLVWSPTFGLRYEEDKGQWAPGTYKRHYIGPSITDWYVLVRTKDKYGRNVMLDWRKVSKESLPKQLLTEALLLDIPV